MVSGAQYSVHPTSPHVLLDRSSQSRYRMPGKRTSEDQRMAILALHNVSWKNARIASVLNISKATVGNVKKLYQSTGSMAPHPSTGRPPKLSPRGKRLAIRLATGEQGKPATKVAHELKQYEGVNISAEGVRRALREKGYHGRRKALKPLLSKKQRNARLKLAQDYAKKDPSPIGDQ